MTTLTPSVLVNVPTHMTIEEFDRYSTLAENVDRRLEWHEGEIIEMVSTDKSSNVAYLLGTRLNDFISERRLGFMTGADGGYIVNGSRYIPDGAYIRTERKVAARTVNGYTSVAPDLAIEAISPTDKPRQITKKLQNYMAAGTVVWLVDPEDYTIDVYTPGSAVRSLTLENNDMLDGGALLPGFSVALTDIFAQLILLAEASESSGVSSADASSE